MIVDHVREQNRDVHIVARASGMEQMHQLHEHGVYEVVQPEFEAGLEMTRQALLHLRFPSTTILHYTDGVRKEMYAPLYETKNSYQALTQLSQAARLLDVEWVELPDDSPLIGQSIAGAHIRSKTGVSIVGLMREKVFEPNPAIHAPLQAGDMVAIMGNPKQVQRFQAWITPDTPPALQP
jgi:CPA2 family monovalent cation:H+ antiporter-2